MEPALVVAELGKMGVPRRCYMHELHRLRCGRNPCAESMRVVGPVCQSFSSNSPSIIERHND